MNERDATFADDGHLGDRAELYALGMLDAAEADEVNAHAARCADCARLVGAAERAVTTLDVATMPDVSAALELRRRIAAIGGAAPIPLRRATFLETRTFANWGGLAAALLVAIVGGVAGSRNVIHLNDVLRQDDVSLAVIANSHFKHATLTKVDPSAPTAKVLWGTSKRWVYVIVDSPVCACRVIAFTAAGERDLGAPLARGATAVLFADNLPAVQRIELRRTAVVVENATLL
jgi:anti-sigma-K factor RskA